MGKIESWREDKINYTNNVEQFRQKIRNISTEKYGRPDVPSYVQRAAESYALRKRVSNRKALDNLIDEAESFEILVSTILKEHKKRMKKTKKMEKEKIETAQK